MALNCELTDTKGITTKYHKIQSINITDCIRVTLASYSDESFREEEKKIKKNKEKKKDLQDKLCYEKTKDQDEKTKEKIEKLSEEIESLPINEVDNVVNQFDYVIPLSDTDSFSFSSIYEQLKKEDKFKDATDC